MPSKTVAEAGQFCRKPSVVGIDPLVFFFKRDG
jgi:hypothetical protein